MLNCRSQDSSESKHGFEEKKIADEIPRVKLRLDGNKNANSVFYSINNNLIHQLSFSLPIILKSFGSDDDPPQYLPDNRFMARLIEAIPHNSSIDTIEINLWDLSDKEALQYIVNLLRKMPSLKKLSISYVADNIIATEHSQQFMSDLATLLKNYQKLQSLTLRNMHIDNKGLELLSQGLRFCTQLYFLDLSENKISAIDPLSVLVSAGEHPLQWLNLNSNPLSKNFMSLLTKMLPGSSLRYLTLSASSTLSQSDFLEITAQADNIKTKIYLRDMDLPDPADQELLNAYRQFLEKFTIPYEQIESTIDSLANLFSTPEDPLFAPIRDRIDPHLSNEAVDALLTFGLIASKTPKASIVTTDQINCFKEELRKAIYNEFYNGRDQVFLSTEYNGPRSLLYHVTQKTGLFKAAKNCFPVKMRTFIHVAPIYSDPVDKASIGFFSSDNSFVKFVTRKQRESNTLKLWNVVKRVVDNRIQQYRKEASFFSIGYLSKAENIEQTLRRVENQINTRHDFYETFGSIRKILHFRENQYCSLFGSLSQPRIFGNSPAGKDVEKKINLELASQASEPDKTRTYNFYRS